MSFHPTPQPFGPPSTPPPARRRSAAAPWIGVGVTLIGLLTATAVLGAPAAPPITGAARWLPADGTRLAFSSADGTHAVEWSRPAPHSLMQLNSPTFTTWAGITEADWTLASYLRVTSQRLDDQAAVQATGEELWLLDDTGARTIAESLSDTIDTIWEPGRLDLPAELAAGSAWSSDGEMAFRQPGADWRSTAYHAAYRAEQPSDDAERTRGCLVVAMTLTINQQELPSQRTWCPEAGVIASQDSESSWSLTTALPPLPLAEPPVFDWSRAGELEFTDFGHSLLGTGYTNLSAIAAPGLLPNGAVAVANRIMPDLIALDPDEDPPPVRWAARPGGTLAAAAGFGGVTVVTTSRRALVAYGPDGQWLWETPLSDLTRVAPVLAGADTVVVVTLDGAVTGFDLATGSQRWRAGMGTEIRRAPVVAGERILVADAGGALSCFDLAGKELWTIDAGRATALAVSAGPEPLVAVGRSDSMVVRGYALADGGEVWHRRILQDARELVSLGDRFVLRDDDQLVGIDAATGAPLWETALRSERAAGGGSHVLLLTPDALLLLDRDGRQLREWPHQLGDVERADSYLATSGDAVIAWGPTGFAVGRLP